MTVLQSVDDNLWLVDGPTVWDYGLPFPTRMAIVRLADGALWLWSPVSLDDDLRREVAKLGEPRYAVEPNKLHHLALSSWVEAWPGLRLYAPPGLAEKRTDLRFTEELTDEPPREWGGEIEQVVVEGSFMMTEVLFHHQPSSTRLVGDLIQKMDDDVMNTWQRLIMNAGGVVGPDGGTPTEWRLSFVHRALAREKLSRSVSWSARRLVIAHGECAMDDGTEIFRHSLRWLLPE